MVVMVVREEEKGNKMSTANFHALTSLALYTWTSLLQPIGTLGLSNQREQSWLMRMTRRQ